MQFRLYKPVWLNVIQIVFILDAVHFSLRSPQFLCSSAPILCSNFSSRCDCHSVWKDYTRDGHKDRYQIVTPNYKMPYEEIGAK